jgi:hypothetical protein
MSPLANDIYAILRRQVPSDDGRIAYGQMVGLLPNVHRIESPRDPRLNEPYTEIVEACRQNGLPALTAILVQVDEYGHLTVPSRGHYPAAYPTLRTREEQEVAWGQERRAVERTTYPESLD